MLSTFIYWQVVPAIYVKQGTTFEANIFVKQYIFLVFFCDNRRRSLSSTTI